MNKSLSVELGNLLDELYALRGCRIKQCMGERELLHLYSKNSGAVSFTCLDSSVHKTGYLFKS